MQFAKEMREACRRAHQQTTTGSDTIPRKRKSEDRFFYCCDPSETGCKAGSSIPQFTFDYTVKKSLFCGEPRGKDVLFSACKGFGENEQSGT